MKLSEWLRGPVPKNDPVIKWLNLLVMAALLSAVIFRVWP